MKAISWNLFEIERRNYEKVIFIQKLRFDFEKYYDNENFENRNVNSYCLYK